MQPVNCRDGKVKNMKREHASSWPQQHQTHEVERADEDWQGRAQNAEATTRMVKAICCNSMERHT